MPEVPDPHEPESAEIVYQPPAAQAEEASKEYLRPGSHLLPGELAEIFGQTGFYETLRMEEQRVRAVEAVKSGDEPEAWRLIYGGKGPHSPSYRRQANAQMLNRPPRQLIGAYLGVARVWWQAGHLPHFLGELEDLRAYLDGRKELQDVDAKVARVQALVERLNDPERQ